MDETARPTEPPEPNGKGLIGVVELSRGSGLSPGTIRYHLERGDWPGLRVGRGQQWRVPRTVLEALQRGDDPAKLKEPARNVLDMV
ncbi:hypothetical protein [Limnoglobus roseus]|uniref:DNA-binding protein n=1 Tax=Limnoglobus roseus TaxID=2598579 RepID=A0A5C1AE68_9BACT|nr:hypothetical protein [Limnoglobus roseus]QEL17531.1 hypothetical protein PX52LOC_04521 [Limnoglobus roseus]